MYKLVIFDMDGVLVDACEWHRVALNEALKQLCNYEISLEEHYKDFNGIPTKVKLQKLHERGIFDKGLISIIEALKQEKTLDAIQKNAFIRQEKIDLMNFLKNKKINIACYTNSIRVTSEAMLEKTGILNFIDLLITNQDVSRPKPDPEGYLLCLKKFNIINKNTIIVEDSEKGLEAAFSSGCKVIKVANQDEVTKNLFKDIL
jgi:beta-phosphoglucomutase